MQVRARVRVTQAEGEAPVEKKVLAQAIVDISRAVRALSASGLNRKAIVLLVAHSSKCPFGTVSAVIDALEQLERDYTT